MAEHGTPRVKSGGQGGKTKRRGGRNATKKRDTRPEKVKKRLKLVREAKAALEKSSAAPPKGQAGGENAVEGRSGKGTGKAGGAKYRAVADSGAKSSGKGSSVRSDVALSSDKVSAVQHKSPKEGWDGGRKGWDDGRLVNRVELQRRSVPDAEAKSETAPEALEAVQRLSIYGERFMRMFDDEDEDSRDKRKGRVPLARVQRGDEPDREGGGDGKDGTEQEDDDARPAAAPHTPTAATGHQSATVHHHVEHWRRDSGDTADLKQELKSFMSPRVADQLKAGAQAPGPGSGQKGRSFGGPGAPGADDKDEARLFRKMAREVEVIGASGLETKQRRLWEAKLLENLGAKPAKSPRVPIKIAQGMQKKRKQQAEEQREEDIASGMVLTKGQGKKRVRVEEKRERGLNASEGRFKDGVLYVKPAGKHSKSSAVSQEDEGERRRKRRRYGKFHEARKRRKGKTKKKGGKK